MSEAPARGAPRPTQRPPQRRMVYTAENRFKYDESRVPPGMTYQWKRISLAGQEDTENLVMMEMNGWEPVPGSRHPELMGQKATADTRIIRGGQMLVQQPTEWAQEARAMDEFEARHTLEQSIAKYHGAAKRSGGRGVSRNIDRIVEPIE